METSYQIHQCERRDCNFRFPVAESQTIGMNCPRCGGRTELAVTSYYPHEVKTGAATHNDLEVEALLDNIRSTFNVGSMLRTADGAGIRHMHLCGITPTPDNPKLNKTALGAEMAVPWTQHSNGLTAAVSLKERGFRLWALEGGPRSEPLFAATGKLHGPPVLLVVGNEAAGIDPDILAQCEGVFSLPMQGAKTTLNVAVAFGIAVYSLRYILPLC